MALMCLRMQLGYCCANTSMLRSLENHAGCPYEFGRCSLSLSLASSLFSHSLWGMPVPAGRAYACPTRILNQPVWCVHAQWPSFFQLPVLMLMLITLLNDGTLISIGYDRVIPNPRPDRWNLRVRAWPPSAAATRAFELADVCSGPKPFPATARHLVGHIYWPYIISSCKLFSCV